MRRMRISHKRPSPALCDFSPASRSPFHCMSNTSVHQGRLHTPHHRHFPLRTTAVCSLCNLFVVTWYNTQAYSRNDAHTGGQRGRSVTPLEKRRLIMPIKRLILRQTRKISSRVKLFAREYPSSRIKLFAREYRWWRFLVLVLV